MNVELKGQPKEWHRTKGRIYKEQRIEGQQKMKATTTT